MSVPPAARRPDRGAQGAAAAIGGGTVPKVRAICISVKAHRLHLHAEPAVTCRDLVSKRPTRLFELISVGFAWSYTGRLWDVGFMETFRLGLLGAPAFCRLWWLLQFVIRALIAICLARHLGDPEASAAKV